MPAMAKIFTPSFPACRFLGVLLRMAVISCRILAVSGRLFRSSTLFSSRHDGVACPATVHSPVFFGISCLAHVAPKSVCLGTRLVTALSDNDSRLASPASSRFQAVCDRGVGNPKGSKYDIPQIPTQH